MTSIVTLHMLRKQLEGVARPSRALDEQMHMHFSPDAHQFTYELDDAQRWLRRRGNSVLPLWQCAPFYTSDVTAALKLRAPGQGLTMTVLDAGPATVETWPLGDGDDGSLVALSATTLALAICLARIEFELLKEDRRHA